MARYEFSEGSSNKFWEIKLAGKSFTTTYGKIGTDGQTTIKTFKSDEEAKKEHDKLVAEKTKKGYALVGGGGTSKAAPPAPDKPVVKKVAKKAAPAPADSDDDEGDDDDEPAKRPASSSPPGTPGARYFEFVEGTSSKFWEISLDGTAVKTRYGKIGTDGQQTLKELDNKAQAFKEFDKLVAEKTKKGYEEKGAGGGGGDGGDGDKRNPDLEQAILSDPYDREAYSVYADWLQGQGDPRGELIALQLAGKTNPADELLEKHADYFWGPLAEHKTTYDGKDDAALTWKFGFIHAANLSHNHYANEEFEGSLAEVLELLLRHPSGRFLTELTMTFNNDPNEDDLQDLIDILAKKAPATLRKIVIGDFAYGGEDTEMSWFNVGKLGKLWKAVPKLQHLKIQGGSFTLGDLELPELKHAAFVTGGLSKASGKSIASATWPKIEHLEVWFGQDEYGGDCTVKDVQPLLDRTDLKSLSSLALMNAQFTDELCTVLAKSKLLEQIKVLDLSKGCMTDAGAAAIAQHKDAFGHLDSLVVTENYLTDVGLKALKGCAKKVDGADQREDDDPEYRHPAVGE
jgi:uncharacterized protein (TIGR02996 family)